MYVASIDRREQTEAAKKMREVWQPIELGPLHALLERRLAAVEIDVGDGVPVVLARAGRMGTVVSKAAVAGSSRVSGRT